MKDEQYGVCPPPAILGMKTLKLFLLAVLESPEFGWLWFLKTPSDFKINEIR